MKNWQILVILVLVGSSLALYEDNSKVIKLTKENFNELVMESSDLWIVEFYAPWVFIKIVKKLIFIYLGLLK